MHFIQPIDDARVTPCKLRAMTHNLMRVFSQVHS
jgi:hypothetical protein